MAVMPEKNRKLALALRDLARASEYSLDTVAQGSGLTLSTVTDVFSGRVVPNRETLDRILQHLGAPKSQYALILSLHREARAELDSRRARRSEISFRSDIPLPQFGQPDPLTVATPAQFVEALRAVRIWAGSPSLRTLEARGRGRLSKSSIGAMLKADELPKYERFVAYLYACGIREKNLDVWVFTWRRLKALQGPESQWMPNLTSSTTSFG
ncbi:helix-turn-helix transcriptional regulator [Streptomyces sp. NPDC005356]|uniref:helix-turn-helix domain-containing protein n=1 Tax=Streptomyces sp. NPDC005356 TaxID=3157167 RepID=UPI0033AB5BA1